MSCTNVSISALPRIETQRLKGLVSYSSDYLRMDFGIMVSNDLLGFDANEVLVVSLFFVCGYGLRSEIGGGSGCSDWLAGGPSEDGCLGPHVVFFFSAGGLAGVI
jgi:hypothetical protein